MVDRQTQPNQHHIHIVHCTKRKTKLKRSSLTTNIVSNFKHKIPLQYK